MSRGDFLVRGEMIEQIRHWRCGCVLGASLGLGPCGERAARQFVTDFAYPLSDAAMPNHMVKAIGENLGQAFAICIFFRDETALVEGSLPLFARGNQPYRGAIRL